MLSINSLLIFIDTHKLLLLSNIILFNQRQTTHAHWKSIFKSTKANWIVSLYIIQFVILFSCKFLSLTCPLNLQGNS